MSPSCFCNDNDDVLSYGNIAQSSASGTASVTIPGGLAAGDYTLKVFSEQCNGDKKTDYASDFQDISLTVEPYTYLISTAEDLKIFRDAVNAGNTDINAKLMNDIDLAGSETNRWTPIGSKDKPYSGIFDGNGKKITGLYVDERGNNRSPGLFGYIGIANSGATVIQNLTVDGTVFAGNEVPEEPVDYYGAGILVGEITVLAGSGVEYDTVKNCHTSGKVSAPMKVGGLAGETQYTHFESCTADVEVTVTTSESRYMGAYSGGFVGRAFQSEFKDCAAYGNVTSVFPSTGGFAGLLCDQTTVEHCAAYGNVEADRWNIGGFVGYVENSGTIKTASPWATF